MRFRKLEARQGNPPVTGAVDDGHRRRQRRAGIVILVFLLLGAALIAAVWFWQRAWITTTGRVMVREIRMTSVQPGRIAAVHVAQGEKVEAGEALIDIAPELQEGQMALAEARAEMQLQQTKAELDALQAAGVDPAFMAAIEIAQLELEQAVEERRLAAVAGRAVAAGAGSANVDLARERRLLELRATTRQDYEKALARSSGTVVPLAAASPLKLAELDGRIRLAQQRLQQAKTKLTHAKQSFEIEVRKRQLAVQATETALELARQRLTEDTIVAPTDGYIGWLSRYPGDVVDKDDVVVTVIDSSEIWVEAYVQASDLGDINEGDAATVRIAGITGEYTGRVALVYPEDRLKFRNIEVGEQTVRNPERLRSAYHAVRIDLDKPLPKGMRPDQTATVRLAR